MAFAHCSEPLNTQVASTLAFHSQDNITADEQPNQPRIIMLRGLLAASGVDLRVITHMVDTLQINSVTDFVCYVKRSDYYDDLGTRILQTLPRGKDGRPHVLCEDRPELLRLQSAYDAAFVAHCQVKKEKDRVNKRKREHISTCVQLPDGQFIGKGYNDARTCTQTETQCPDGRCHVCDVRKPDGTACGSRSHTRMSRMCPYIFQQFHSKQK